MRLGFIGAGKVGATLAYLWYERGYTIGAITSRTPAHAEALADETNALFLASSSAVADHCDIVFLTVPDATIATVATEIARDMKGLEKKVFVHTSGTHTVDALVALQQRGCVVGSLHPVFPFAKVETSRLLLPGAAFAIEAVDSELKMVLTHLVASLDGKVIYVPANAKPLYHAALVMASNYAVTLYYIAERMLSLAGAEKEAGEVALNRLLDGTINNLHQQDTAYALTGPLTRNDVGTITSHLDSIHRMAPDLAEVYKVLARQTYDLLRERNLPIDDIEFILRQDDERYGTDNNS